MKTVAMTVFTGGGGTQNSSFKGFWLSYPDLLNVDQNNGIMTNMLCIKVKKEVNVKKDLKKTAFTLAEVLITLGIIGIVAAMTLPTLIANHQKKVTATRLSQTYSQLSQALNLAQVEYGDMKNWDVMQNVAIDSGNPNQGKDMTIKFVDTYMAPHLKLSSKSSYAKFADKGYSDYVRKDGSVYLPKSGRIYISELSNGVTLFWSYNGTPDTISVPYVFVDINGKAKPNMMGRDFFMFHFFPTKPMMLEPYGYGSKRVDLLGACRKGAGVTTENFGCTALIMLDGWEIKGDHPW